MDRFAAPRAMVLQHSLIAIAVPFLLIYSIAVVLIDGAFAQYGAAFFPPAYALVLLFAGVAEIASTRASVRKGETGFLPRLRSAIVALVFSAFLVLLLYGDIGSGHIGIDRFNRWLSLILAMLQWTLTATITAKLRMREFVYRAVGDREGDDLAAAYATHNHEAGEAIAGFRKIRVLSLIFPIILFTLLFLVLWVGGVEPPAGVTVFFAGAVVVYVFICSAMNRYRDGLVAMGFGNTSTKRGVRAKRVMAFLLVTLCAATAALVTGRSSILPEQQLRDAINYLIEVSWRQPDMEPAKLPAFQSDAQAQEIERLVEVAGELAGSSYRESPIWRYLGYAIGVMLGIGVLAFVLAPVVRSLRRGVSLRSLVGGFFRRVWDEIRGAFGTVRDFVRNAVRRGRAIRERVGELRRQAKAAVAARRAEVPRTPAAREERIIRAQALRLFFRFVKWGKRSGVPFRNSLGPREYAERVAVTRPEHAAETLSVAELYEELAFSDHTNRDAVQARLAEVVGALVKVR